MNKAELIEKIASASGVGKSDVDKVVNSFIETVQGAVAVDDKVTLPGFGAWSRSQRKARVGRNPRTGDPVNIPASKAVKFSVGAKFKEQVNR